MFFLTSWGGVWVACVHAVCRDGYTIGYYGRPFEARNKVRLG
jgi:hypothetical protein